MVDRIDDEDWERLDESRETERLKTQTEIEDWLYTRWIHDEKGNRVKVDIRKAHNRGEWKDKVGGKWRIRHVEPVKTSGIDKLGAELYRPVEIQKKIEDATATKLPKKSDIDEVMIPSRRDTLLSNLKSKAENIAIEASDKKDVNSIKEISKNAPDSETRGKIDNYGYNTILSISKELRDIGDIAGLKNLKSNIVGLRDEAELSREIDYRISKVEDGTYPK